MATARTTSAKKSPARKAGAAKKQAPAKKAAARKAGAAKKQAPAKKAVARKAGAAKKQAPTKKQSPAKKAAARKAGAARKQAPTKKAVAATASVNRTGSARKPAVKKAPRKSRLGEKFINEQREALLAKRSKLAEQADALKAEADSLANDREPGDVQFDDESGEGDTLAVERDFDLARVAQNRHTIDEIDAALKRIEKGTYGICEYSGEPIPRERLEAVPEARERVEFKTQSFR